MELWSTADGDKVRRGRLKRIGADYLFRRVPNKEANPEGSPEPDGAVLLIDEVDRSDEAFEAYLLEALSDYQVSIPEIGPVRSQVDPIVILTSNGTRDLSDATGVVVYTTILEYPDVSREAAILG